MSSSGVDQFVKLATTNQDGSGAIERERRRSRRGNDPFDQVVGELSASLLVPPVVPPMLPPPQLPRAAGAALPSNPGMGAAMPPPSAASTAAPPATATAASPAAATPASAAKATPASPVAAAAPVPAPSDSQDPPRRPAGPADAAELIPLARESAGPAPTATRVRAGGAPPTPPSASVPENVASSPATLSGELREILVTRAPPGSSLARLGAAQLPPTDQSRTRTSGSTHRHEHPAEAAGASLVESSTLPRAADAAAAVLLNRRSVERHGAKPIELQVDSSLMSMLQRSRSGESQPRSAPLPEAAPGPTPDALPVPFDSADLGGALATQLGQLVASGTHEAVIRLAPDEFGSLEVRVTLHEGQVNVAFGAAVAQTRAVLEQALPQLRELLGAAGLRLLDASIASQLARGAERPGGLPSRASAADLHGGGAEFGGPPAGFRRSKRTDLDLYV